MTYLGVDWGSRRIGLAIADDELKVALSLPAATEPTEQARHAHLASVIAERKVGALVVGYPYNMDSSVGFKAREVDVFIKKMEAAHGLPVYRVDERLTSQAAQSLLEQSQPRKARSKRTVKAALQQRRSGKLDSQAAAIILQDYLSTLS
jgi:putative Holliday junction resolvase